MGVLSSRGGEVGEGEWIEVDIFGAVVSEGRDGPRYIFGGGVGAEDVCVDGGAFADEGCARREVGKGGEDIGGVDGRIDVGGRIIQSSNACPSLNTKLLFLPTPHSWLSVGLLP